MNHMTATEVAMRVALQKAKSDERIVRSLLGKWVSEFEPSVAWHNGQVVGLSVAGDPTGSMPIRVFDVRPMLDVLARHLGVESPSNVKIQWSQDLGHD